MNTIKKAMLGSCIALALAASTGFAAESTMGTAIDDASLTAKVKSTLIENPATKARQIDVETKAGVVQLNGFVDTAEAKSAAETAAQSVAGVVSVDNNLEVKAGERTAGNAMDDSAITGKVKTALIADKRTKAHEIEVKTYKGVVTLGGFVASSAEKQAAGSITQNVPGVMKVENGIKVSAK
jgi:hyperosmotically inducible protein